jgi:uncharacterized protein (DUF2141 family)
MSNLISLIFTIFLNFIIEQNHTLTLRLTGFSSNQGKAMIMLLDKNEKPIQKHIVEIHNKEAHFQFKNLAIGHYAIKAFHDLNENGKLETNLLGMPTEPWGVSNNLRATFGPPNFKKMLVEVNKDLNLQIKLSK